MAENIPSQKEWLDGTNRGVLSVRSAELRAIDQALGNYWIAPAPMRQRARNDLAAAMARWIGKEGPQWRDNPRNAPPGRMVERLYNSLNTSMFSEADLEAFAFQNEQAWRAIKELFMNLEVVDRFQFLIAQTAADNKREVVSKWQYFKTMVKSAKTGVGENKATIARQAIPAASAVGRGVIDVTTPDGAKVSIGPAIINLFQSLRPDDMSQTSFEAVVLEVMGESLASVAQAVVEAIPILGLGASAVSVMNDWRKVIVADNEISTVRNSAPFLMPGGEIADALAALESHLVGLRRYTFAKAGISSTALSSKLVALAADGGAVTSAAISTASLLASFIVLLKKHLYNVAMRDRCNQALDSADFFKTLGKSPLLGCYILLLQDTSQIINLVRAEKMRKQAVKFGSLGWKEEVEWIKKKHIDPIRKIAAQVVAESKFVLRDKYTRRFYLLGEHGRIYDWKNTYEKEQARPKVLTVKSIPLVVPSQVE